MIKSQEIINFINAQPDDRPVNMGHNLSKDSCGCVMVHYAKEVLGLNNFECGWDDIYSNEENFFLTKRIDEIIDFTGVPVNYGEVKKCIIIQKSGNTFV